MRTDALDSSGMLRSSLFALTGILLLVSWEVGPSYDIRDSMARWLVVLLFSATLLSLAVALPVFGRMVGGRHAVRLATIAGAGAGLGSVVNIFEDGFQIEWFFFVFVVGLLILDVALLALAIVIARTAPDRYRLLAVIPAATLAGILFPMIGGPVMLIAWLAAAAAAVKMRGRPAPTPATRPAP